MSILDILGPGFSPEREGFAFPEPLSGEGCEGCEGISDKFASCGEFLKLSGFGFTSFTSCA